MKTTVTTIAGAVSLVLSGLLASSCSYSEPTGGTHRMGTPGKDREMKDSEHQRTFSPSHVEGSYQLGPPGKR
jgi:hypothetical protein